MARSRRRLFLVLMSVSAVVLAACGGGGTSQKSSAHGAGGGLNPAGILRVGAELSAGPGGNITFDPTQAVAQGINIEWQLAVYDTFLHRDAKTGAFTPGLATAANVVNPTALSLTIRPNVTFSDGTPFDAAAVKAGLLRNKNAAQHGQFNSTLQQITTIDVTSPVSVTINFNSPVAGVFFEQLSLPSSYIVSPTAAQRPGANLGADPVGAGPYKLQSYVPNESITLVKNPSYWDAQAIKLGSLEFVNVSTGPPEVSALEAGTVDVEALSGYDSISALQSQFTIDEAGNTPYESVICKSDPPLNSMVVRQALNYAINRPQIVSSVMDGAAKPMIGVWPPGSPYYDSSLEGFYSYDPTKAKQLLKAAGYPNGFRTSLVVFPGAALTQMYQIIQQEWAAIGVQVSLVQPENAIDDFFVRHVAPLNLAQGGTIGDYGPIAQVTPGNLGDVCNYNSPAIGALYQNIAALDPRSPQAIADVRQLQALVYKQALMVFIVNAKVPVAYDSKVRGFVANPYYESGSSLDYWSGLGVAK